MQWHFGQIIAWPFILEATVCEFVKFLTTYPGKRAVLAFQGITRLFRGIRFIFFGFWAPILLPVSQKRIYLFPRGHSTAQVKAISEPLDFSCITSFWTAACKLLRLYNRVVRALVGM